MKAAKKAKLTHSGFSCCVLLTGLSQLDQLESDTPSDYRPESNIPTGYMKDNVSMITTY